MHLNLKFKFETVNFLLYYVQNTSPFAGSRSSQSDHRQESSEYHVIATLVFGLCGSSTRSSRLIGSSRMLVRDFTLLMADVDRTSSIDVCWLLGCSGSSARLVERLMDLSLRFGGLTTLVAHQSHFPNPR